VNARTGEVQGERPWSWIKIALAAIAVVVAIMVVAEILQRVLGH
jgi:small neutral amino acid transporter SnatA (MarC family)